MRIELIGHTASLHTNTGSARLERKAAGLIAYLALEGPTIRGRLAGLLWPESEKAAARNNLAQTLHRLKTLNGGSVPVEGDDILCLSKVVECDVAALVAPCSAETASNPTGLDGVLLGDYDYSDCPDFSEWLETRRARLTALRHESAERLADEAERVGDWRTALRHAKQSYALDGTHEEACRRVMRLHYLLGDRGSALKAYEQCKRTLLEELGVSPSSETEALAALILKSFQIGPARSRREMPLAVQRPPSLIGRDEAWAKMDEAWARRQAIFVSGPPGIGKTRLVQDFLATKDRADFFEGRPSDIGVPFATHSRTYRAMLHAFPGLAVPDWVRRELSRILPELGEALPLPKSDAEKLLFFQAKAEATRLAVEAGMRNVVVDDLHYVDKESMEAAHFVYAQHWGHPEGMRTILCLQEEGLAEPAREVLAEVVNTGAAIRICLEPLSPAEIQQLIESLDLDVTVAADDFAQYSGGNPFFLLELIRGLLETEVTGASRSRLGVPGTVKDVIGRRLSRLSLAALELVRLAATAGHRFEPGLAAFVLKRPLLSLAEPWTELDRAQILIANAFTHGIVRETVIEAIPAAILEHIETLIAEYETKHGRGRRKN